MSEYSLATMVTESGYAAGLSRRYNEEPHYKPNIPTGNTGVGGGIVGLPDISLPPQNDPGFTDNPDARETGSFDNGEAAWVTRQDHTAFRVGLTDALHTDATSGWQNSVVTHLTETGWAAGYSTQTPDFDIQSTSLSNFVGSYGSPETAWVVNIENEETIALQLSTSASGFSHSQIKFLSDEGIVLGFYVLFDNDVIVGERAFAYLPGLGTFDIGENLDANLSDAGWDYLQNGLLLHPDGYILGYGNANSSNPNNNLYLAQVVPEPSTYLPLVFALVGLLLKSKSLRKKQGWHQH